MIWTLLFFMTVCAFPYVIAFTSDTMEIRLIINGNLVHTIAMPNINLITSKRDVFFATTAPEFLPGKCERIRLDSKPLEKEEMPCSPPPTAQSSSSRASFQSTWPYSASLSSGQKSKSSSPDPDRSLPPNVWWTHWGHSLVSTEKSSFRRQSGRLETDKNLSDTSTDAVEKHRLQLQPEEMPESHGTGNRFRTTYHGPHLPQRRAASYAEQILQQQSYTYADHEFAAIV